MKIKLIRKAMYSPEFLTENYISVNNSRHHILQCSDEGIHILSRGLKSLRISLVNAPIRYNTDDDKRFHAMVAEISELLKQLVIKNST